MSRGVLSPRLAFALLLLPAAVGAGGALRFDFGKDGNAADHPSYDESRGFGFEATNAGAPEKFSIKVPEGNYRLTLTLAGRIGAAGLIIDAEQRRRMIELRATPRRAVSFLVNVRFPELAALPLNAAGGTRVILKPREIGSANWDDKLTLAFSPDASAVAAIVVEPASPPTLYLAGDSTVTDQPTAPNASWGQFLTAYFDDRVAVANHAESGESLKSFVTGMRLAKLLSGLREGDWVMIQFGHNDQKSQWPQTYADAATTYRAWLRTYIAEIRGRGATPLLVTSPERRNFDTDGRIRPTLAEYAAAMRAVAKQERVALLDLNALSIRLYESLGPGVAPRAFADGGDDHTHHNEYGARQLARCVIEALRGANSALTGGLEKHITAARFDVADPPLPD
jgi:lysophospholipase L1-like esterase